MTSHGEVKSSPRKMPLLLIALLSLATGTSSINGQARPARVPWQTSKVSGSPDAPPPFKVVRTFAELKFDHPLLLVRGPGNRLFIGEQAGVLYSFVDRPDAKADLFFDLRKEIQTVKQLPGAQGIEAVYGLAFHPRFNQNRYCYICYTLRGPGGKRNFENGSRVSRFTVTDTEPPRVDPASEQILLSFPQGGHNGGDLHFGPDGMLYISTGDAGDPNPPDPFNTGQDISDLLSSILRIDVDRQDEDQKYAVPTDNPFVKSAKARPEVWAYGFRNPWRMSFDRATGELFVGDVGWELWESIHRVERGGNYGWAAMEGPQPIKTDQVGSTPVQPPLIELPHTIACSITGGLVYRGKRFPLLHGAYIFGDWETRRLWSARFTNDRTKEMVELAKPSIRFVAFSEDHAGELLCLDQEAGTIHTLAKNDAGELNAHFPTTLGQTGLFASVEKHLPADGVRPFSINARQWRDGATSEHWVAFPESTAATLFTSGKPIPGMVSWHNFRMHFPKDAVLMRTFSLGALRLETQLLHYDGTDWRGYTYAWRDDQTDADLVPADGAEKEIRIAGRLRTWQFHSRSQCLSCHSNQSEYALAFLPEQLNRPTTSGVNQLVSLTEEGWIQRADDNRRPLPPFDQSAIAREPRIADPIDTRLPLADRARGYLHANCGHCHSDHGGGSVPLRLSYATATANMKAIDARPTRGDFGLPEARIIKPGDPFASTLYFRMAKFGRDRMPHIGAELPDEIGLQLVGEWIQGLSPVAELPSADIAEEVLDPRAAQLWARRLARDELDESQKEKLLHVAAKLPPGPLRDLYEGYLPAEDAGERKLGTNIRPRTILNLAGDAARGETLFWSATMQCAKCHRIGDRGTAIGPDLSAIGKLRSREDLLESLVMPSRRIEPKYATYLAQTADGAVASGLLVKRDDQVVVLRNAEGKEITFPAETLEELRPLLTSQMPEGQLSGLTPQAAADLLEYLTTRK